MNECNKDDINLLKELAEAFHEHIEVTSLDCKDPFDFYVNRLQASVYSSPSHVSERLSKGLSALLSNMKN